MESEKAKYTDCEKYHQVLRISLDHKKVLFNFSPSLIRLETEIIELH